MEPILPNLAALLGTTARAETPPLRAQVLNLPAQLLQAAAPVSLTGVVTENGIGGQLRIATPLGDVQVRTPTELAVGRSLTIVTRPANPAEVFLLPSQASASAPPTGTGLPAATPAPASLPQGPPAAVASSTGETPIMPGRPTPSVQPWTPVGAGVAAQPNPPHSGTTLDPSSLLATFETPALPESAGRTPYASVPQAGASSELLAVLTDLRRLVAQRDPKLAERLQRRLPTPDRGGAIAMLALPVAARQERLATWLGRDIIDAVAEEPHHVAADLMPRLGNALTHVEERFEENGERAWRWRQLPMVDNGQLVALSIGMPPDHGQAAPDGRGRQPRGRAATFAVEVSLSALGTTRVEATYRDRHLDLVVESEAAFDPDSRARIAEAVGSVLDEFGMSGSCRFTPYRRDPAVAVKV